MFRIVLGIVLSISCGCATVPTAADQVEESLRSWGVTGLEASGYQLSSIGSPASQNVEVWQAQGPGGRLLRARKVKDPASAKDLFQESLIKLRSIYDVRRDAYFAVITKDITCPEEFKIRESSLPDGRILSMYANDRGTLGACDEQTARARVSVALLLCGPSFIRVESFVPREVFTESDERMLTSLQCLR